MYGNERHGLIDIFSFIWLLRHGQYRNMHYNIYILNLKSDNTWWGSDKNLEQNQTSKRDVE